MRNEALPPPSFLKTVGLLLRTARARSAGRRHRQQQLLHNKTGKSSASPLGVLGILLASLFGLMIHGAAAFLVYVGVHASQRYEAEREGKIVVSSSLMRDLNQNLTTEQLRYSVHREAERTAEQFGGREKDIEDRLWAEILQDGGARLVGVDDAEAGFRGLTGWSGLAQMVGSLTLILWLVMMICQGEGMELDLQRRQTSDVGVAA